MKYEYLTQAVPHKGGVKSQRGASCNKYLSMGMIVIYNNIFWKTEMKPPHSCMPVHLCILVCAHMMYVLTNTELGHMVQRPMELHISESKELLLADTVSDMDVAAKRL